MSRPVVVVVVLPSSSDFFSFFLLLLSDFFSLFLLLLSCCSQVRAASCIINLVASLDSPDASLKALREGLAPDGAIGSSSTTTTTTTMTSHVLFLTIHSLTLEMASLLPLHSDFLTRDFPTFASSFPSLLASTTRLLVAGNHGETTLLVRKDFFFV